MLSLLSLCFEVFGLPSAVGGLYPPVAETSGRMVTKSLKMRVVFDIFRLKFEITRGELQQAWVHGGLSAIIGDRIKPFSDHPPACLNGFMQC